MTLLQDEGAFKVLLTLKYITLPISQTASHITIAVCASHITIVIVIRRRSCTQEGEAQSWCWQIKMICARPNTGHSFHICYSVLYYHCLIRIMIPSRAKIVSAISDSEKEAHLEKGRCQKIVYAMYIHRLSSV